MADVLSGVTFDPTPTPTPPTAQQATIAALVDGVQKLFVYNVNERIRLYNLFWNNPGKDCSPAQLAVQAGTALTSTFAADIALVTFLATRAAASAVTLPAAATAGIPDGWVFTPNPDGSGSVTAAPKP